MIACQLSASHDPLESLGGNFPNGPDNVFGKGAHAFPDGFPVFRCIKFHAHQGAAYAFPSVGIVEITEGSQIRDAFHEVKEGAGSFRKFNVDEQGVLSTCPRLESMEMRR